MAFPSYSTGTVSVSAGGTVVTGVGTLWTSNNVRPGDDIVIAGQTVVVMDFTDATHLVINPWPASFGTQSGVAYKLIQRSPLRYNASQTMLEVDKVFTAMNTDGYYFFVDDDETEPNPSYGNDGQYAMQATTGKLWVKSGGIWVFVGINKGFGLPLPWSSATAYNAYDVASYNGSSYVCILPHTNHAPPNATYWTLLASIGTAATITVGSVATGAGGDGAAVWNTGTSGAAVLNFSIPQGKQYSTTSTSTVIVGTGAKTFVVDAGLATLTGARYRATNSTNWMEGQVIDYVGSSMTILVTKVFGSGTFSTWNLTLAGEPGAGDMSSANNLSDVASAATSRTNLGLGTGALLASSAIVQTANNLSDLASASTARTNLGLGSSALLASSAVAQAANNLSDLASAPTARTNLGLGTAAVRADTHFPRTDAAQSLTSTQKKQARANAGVNDVNLAYNGNFRINRRDYTSSALAAGAYGHDRWKAGAGGCTYAYTSATLSNIVNITVGSLKQILPARDLPAGGTFTISWTGTATGRVGVNTATPSGSYAASPITITGQTEGATMSYEFTGGNVGEVKVEPGAFATPFVAPDPFNEEARCNSFYRVIGNPPGAGLGNTSSVFYYWSFPLSEEMIGNPAVTLTGDLSATTFASGFTITGITTNYSTKKTFMVDATLSSPMPNGFAVLTSNSNGVILDAEI